MVDDVVERQGDVEGVEFRDESGGAVAIGALVDVGVVVAAVVLHPLGIPRAFAVWSGIILGGLFTDPEDGGDDVAFPAVARSEVEERERGLRTGGGGFFCGSLGCGGFVDGGWIGDVGHDRRGGGIGAAGDDFIGIAWCDGGAE